MRGFLPSLRHRPHTEFLTGPEDLIDSRSEWEHELAADEARFGMSQDRPEIELPAATDKAGPAPTTAAVLDQIGRILINIRGVIQPSGPHAS